MKKMFRKSISWLLSVMMIFGLFVAMPITVHASTGSHSQQEAVAWAKSKIGSSIDVDGAYGAQCVDLIKAYYQYLGTSAVLGNGCDYSHNSLPSGWTRIQNTASFVPEPGDIVVWTDEGWKNGHVAIFISGNSSNFTSIDQNWPKGTAVSEVYHSSYKYVWGVIRPDFTVIADNCNCSSSYAGDYVVSTQSSSLTIRNGHGTSYASIGSIPKGTQIYVSKADGNWAHVSYNGASGYVSMNYLTKVTQSNPDPVIVPVPDPDPNLTNVPDDSNLYCNVEKISSGNNSITVVGWAFDKDNTSEQVFIDIYIGGYVGTDAAEGHRILANGYRSDVNSVHGCGDYHGFYATIPTQKTGVQPVYLYGINIGSGSINPCVGSGSVNISDPPKDIGTGFYAYIVNTSSGKVVGEDDDNIILKSKTNTKDQQWYFERQDDCSYEIKNPAKGKCLEVAEAGTDNGSNIRLWSDNDTIAQRWYVVGTTDNYTLVPKYATNKAMDISGGITNDGTNIQLWDKNNTKAQIFSFEKFNADTEKPVISNVRVSDISKDGYSISCNVTDNVGVTKVLFPTWTEENGQDDIIYYNVPLQGNLATHYVKASDHNNETSRYITHIYAYDAAGNYSVCGYGIQSLIQYQISYDLNGGNGSIESQSKIPDYDIELWDIVPENDDCEFVGWDTNKNSKTAKYQPGDTFSVDEDTTLYAIWKAKHNYTEKVESPTCTEMGYTLHTCSDCGDSYKDNYTDALGHSYTETIVASTTTEQGYTLHTCSRCGDSYKDNYTDPIADIAAESLTLDKSTVDLSVGQLAIVTATISPTNATDKNVTWTSTDTAVATVTDGVIQAVGNGQAVVIAKTCNGLTQYVIVNVKASEVLKNNSKISATTVAANTNVNLTAVATGGTAPYTYAFMYKLNTATSWKVIGTKFGTKSTATFKPTQAGTYDVLISVKDSTGKSVAKKFALTVTAPVVYASKSTINATDVTCGTKIILTGAAEGGTEPYYYTYQYQKPDKTSWITLGEKYGTAESANFTPKVAGTYKARVLVKDSKGTVKSSVFTVNVTGELLVNNSTINATTVTLGNKVTITTKTNGGTKPFYYTYEYKAPSASKWTTIGKRNSANITASFTPTSTGTYEARVYIKDAGGFVTVKNFKVTVK